VVSSAVVTAAVVGAGAVDDAVVAGRTVDDGGTMVEVVEVATVVVVIGTVVTVVVGVVSMGVTLASCRLQPVSPAMATIVIVATTCLLLIWLSSRVLCGGVPPAEVTMKDRCDVNVSRSSRFDSHRTQGISRTGR
jgi:hypothetical protein